MGTVYNRKGFGLYNNGCGQFGDNTNFSSFTTYTTDSISNSSCFGMENTAMYGSGMQGDEYIPVDITKTYQLSVSIKGLTNNYLGNPAGGHLGFATYDSSFRFIYLNNCGDLGNTTLSRTLTAGDSYAYLTSDTGWFTGADVTSNAAGTRNLIIFPATHPEYSTPHEYSRIGYGDYYIYYKSMTWTGTDWELKLCNSSNADITMPDIGYSTPAGTPISRGNHGGTYNYAHGAPNHTTGSWTTYTTSPFTGANRNSSTPFRYGTAYIRFLNLRNYNTRTENGGVSPTYALDNIMLVECPNGTAWPASLFNKTNTL
jgi:hypothetical protein